MSAFDGVYGTFPAHRSTAVRKRRKSQNSILSFFQKSAPPPPYSHSALLSAGGSLMLKKSPRNDSAAVFAMKLFSLKRQFIVTSSTLKKSILFISSEAIQNL